MSEYAVEVKNVSMRFNLATERVDSLKEYIIKRLKGNISFDEFYALKNVTFRVKKGDAFAIVGSNGSGKSTMLKIISGILRPTEGKVIVEGMIAPLIELGAGFDMDLTARENIFLNGAVLGYSRELLTEKFDEIIEFADLKDFIDVPVKNFSSGMVARLGFSIATIVKPEILIVDEILSVGDQAFKKKCEKRMHTLMAGGTTIILVSHSIDEVRNVCKHAIWIEKSQLKYSGNVDEVYCQYIGEEYIKEYGENNIGKNRFAFQNNSFMKNLPQYPKIDSDEICNKQEERKIKCEISLETDVKKMMINKNIDIEKYRERLYTPTLIAKEFFGGTPFYFIVDCWHHRIIYSEDLNLPISEWQILTNNIAGPLSLACDGELLIAEDTGRHALMVFKYLNGIFSFAQYISNVGVRPHRTIYDPNSKLFFSIGSFSQNIVAIKNESGTARIKYNYQLPFLSDYYVRAIRIIEGKMYFISAQDYIIVCDYIDESYEIVDKFYIGDEFANTNDLVKIDDYFYLSSGNKKIIRFKDFKDIVTNSYEDIYETLNLEGTPYFITSFDGAFWLTEMNEVSKIKSFRVKNNKIIDVSTLLDFGSPKEEDIYRFCQLPK